MPEVIMRLIDKAPARRMPPPEMLGGGILLVATAAALTWANSPWAETYEALWSLRIGVEIATWELSKPLLLWVNDFLMAVFFLLVGLEIKREFLLGDLSSARSAALPVAAALGGMIVPALLYLSLNAGGPGREGWGVPMATDIAFALGLLTVVGRGVPIALKVFLAAVAIVDDLGAILVIAFVYTSEIALQPLAAAAALLALLVVANRMGVRVAWPYLLLGAGLWYAFLRSGVHATVAGVLLAATIPMGPVRDAAEGGLLLRIEHGLRPWVAYAIVPVFALANAGVALGVGSLEGLFQPVGLGVVLGLVIGKQAGIMGFSWLAVRSGVAQLPVGVTWRHLQGAAALAGVGFTMALFIGGLAFPEPALYEQAKVAILAGSLVSALAARALFAKASQVAVEGQPSPITTREGREPAADRPRDEAA